MQEQLKIGPSITESNYLFHIKSVFDSLPKSYQKVARFILDHPDNVSSSSITQVAKKLDICTSTITRFSQSLG
ncbi:MAG: hypothetical protein LBR29_08990, partial [Methylobacteriaceae bacterium]|nr:hypothetical protein [Methylobacteriaceae bacterium]